MHDDREARSMSFFSRLSLSPPALPSSVCPALRPLVCARGEGNSGPHGTHASGATPQENRRGSDDTAQHARRCCGTQRDAGLPSRARGLNYSRGPCDIIVCTTAQCSPRHLRITSCPDDSPSDVPMHCACCAATLRICFPSPTQPQEQDAHGRRLCCAVCVSASPPCPLLVASCCVVRAAKLREGRELCAVERTKL